MRYTTKEAAQRLNVQPDTIRRYIRQGVLKAFRLNGRNWRIDAASLAGLLKAGEG